MIHPDVMRMLAADHIETLRRDARRPPVLTPRRVADGPDVELRLCTVADDEQLERLAALAERPVPSGRLVLAAVGGEIVAAVPLAGGAAIRDPFVRTEHLVPLLQLRAAQLRGPEPRRSLIPRYVSLIRGSIHA